MDSCPAKLSCICGDQPGLELDEFEPKAVIRVTDRMFQYPDGNDNVVLPIPFKTRLGVRLKVIIRA